jgi:hypothetical protein
MSAMSRRELLRGAAVGTGAGLVVVGWDPERGFAASTEGDCSRLEGIPPLDGALLTDPGARSRAGDDFGDVIHNEPCAVLQPGSVDDIVKVIRFARTRGIHVSMRGQGNSSYGQSQVLGGISIDSSAMNRILSLGPEGAVVEPGVLWRTLNSSAATEGLRVPVLTDYQGLTVGGTLSLGGPDSGPAPFGALIDNVLSLKVVTGRGNLVECGPDRRRRLFNAVLGGLGQFAIVVEATLAVLPMPASVLAVILTYDDVQANIADMSMLLRTDRFDQFEQVVMWEPPGRWVFRFVGGAYFTPPDAPDPAALLEGLHDDASKRVITPMSYPTWVSRFDPLSESVLKTAPAKNVPFSGWVPEAAAPQFLGDFFANATGDDLGGGPGVLLPVDTARMNRPVLSLPEDISFGLILFKRASDDAQAQAMLAANREMHDALVAVGGKRYPFDSIPDLKQRDWRRHFGAAWPFVKRSKWAYDADHILGSGWGIFSSTDQVRKRRERERRRRRRRRRRSRGRSRGPSRA